MRDKPDAYHGRRRASEKPIGAETLANIESATPVVYLGIESAAGLGDVVVVASMSFKAAVQAVQDFSSKIEGVEIFPERMYLPSAGPVQMRTKDGSSSPYRVEPVDLL
jgi:hypothetical protein